LLPLNNSTYYTLNIQQKKFDQNFVKKASFFFNFLSRNFFIGFLLFDDWITFRVTENDWNRCLFVNLSILNGPEEGQSLGGWTGRRDLHALLREDTSAISDRIGKSWVRANAISQRLTKVDR